MALKKPPLVEVWLSFRFEPAAGNPEWDRKRYEVFLGMLANTHPNVEEMAHRAVQLAASRSGKPPRVKQLLEKILAVRAISEDGLHVVQMTPDLLAVNYVRGDTEPYPGFSTLLDVAMGHCRKYTDCYRPAGVVEAAVHYVDAVEVPVPKDRALQSEEYFTIQFETPVKTFGGLVALEVKAMMLPPR